MKHAQEITNRYILPTIEEKTAYGYKRLDPYTKLFEERIIFLGQAIDVSASCFRISPIRLSAVYSARALAYSNASLN